MKARHAIPAAILALTLLVTSAFAGAASPRTSLISKTSGGDPATGGGSSSGGITPTGRFVAFSSNASNLPGATGYQEIYVRDRKTDKTKLVSRTSGGDPADGGGSYDPSISASGRFVAFESSATNLPGPNGNAYDLVYVRDRKTGTTSLVSRTSGGAPADDFSQNASISGSGRFVLFDSIASNLPGALPNFQNQVYLRDRKTGKTKLVSRTSGGEPADADSNDPAISRNGRFLGFESQATNLPGSLGGNKDQVYLRDRKTGKTKLVSRTSGGSPGNDRSDDVMVSASGRLVGFASYATNLPGSLGPTYLQVYLRDRKTDTTTLVSRTSGGDPASGGESEDPSVSDSGRFVLFESEATNLPGAPGSFFDQVYIRDRRTGKTRLVGAANDGSPAESVGAFIEHNASLLTRDGRFALFGSSASNLPGADPPYAQAYIRGPLH